MTRAEALAAGKSTYWTGKPCKHGHVAERYVLNWTCVTCHAQKCAKYLPKWRDKNQEKQAEYAKKYAVTHAASTKLWRAANKDRCLTTQREWNHNNAILRNSFSRAWRDQNRDVMLAHKAKRRAALLRRTPVWLTNAHLLEMQSVYTYCAALRRVGLDYHVDHVVPLRGQRVSGLHVPWNLQVIPGRENTRKGNVFNG
jgi:hypothetical protein